MSVVTGLYCEQCTREVPESEFKLRCPDCNGLVEVQYDLDAMANALSDKFALKGSDSFLKKWREILPIGNPELIDRISINELETPLVRSTLLGEQIGIKDLRFKLEFTGPTLSLKDRGTSLCILKALELGYDTVCIPSSGNNAASVATYAAKAGLRAVVFIQKNVFPSKVLKIMATGARVVRLNGDMSTASKVCREMLKNHRWFNCGGGNPYRFTAKRIVAYEIIKQLGGRVPDAVVFPVGGGVGMASAYSAFLEMYKMKIIPSVPRMIGVQLKACDPITQAFDAKLDRIPEIDKKTSISDALMNSRPVRGMQTLNAARNTGGFFVSVKDEEFLNMIHLLASKEGLFLEPAGAVSVAGVRKLVEQKRLKGAKTVICTLTGHGLNSPNAALDKDSIPELIEPKASEVESFLSR